MPIGSHHYVDGATGLNNPVEVALEEARSIWSDALIRLESIISIGTGLKNPQAFGDDMIGILKTLKVISTDTEKTHQRFLRSLGDLGINGRYFRYNIDKGLEDVSLDDHGKIGIIEAATQAYLGLLEVQSSIESLASLLPPNGAGSGKTVLASNIVEKLESTIREDKSGLLAYFYLSFQNKSVQSLRILKTSILIQLLSRLANKTTRKDFFYLPSSFRRLYKTYHPSLLPKEGDIDMVLKDILEEEERGFIVVDALDECDSLHHRIEVLEFLSWLIAEVKCDLRILVTSRPEHGIVNAMTELKVPKCFVPFDTDSVNQDIHAHLVGLMCRAPYSRWAKSIQNEVITQITAESDGVFRWADLQIQSLEKFSRKPDIRRVLARLPKGLNQTYERMLDTIDEDYVQDASAVLRWLCYSRLPLTLKQLAEIAAFRRSTGNQVVFDPEYRFEDPSEILAILTGLITVLEHNEPHEDPQDNMVILSHFSVSQYLKSRDVTRPEFQMIDHDSAWFMVQSSLAYLGHYDNPLERLTSSKI
ncbi:uncharacterized protein PG998_011525 [Apiospora kogelbergensis]|uniref:uncharacterized protein n=1 Tax=Apiospora kogelbergensis TaxID=1337665 RepID=UPI003130FD26